MIKSARELCGVAILIHNPKNRAHSARAQACGFATAERTKKTRKLKHWSYGRHKAVHAQWAYMVREAMHAAGANATRNLQSEVAGAHISPQQGSL